MPMSGRNTHASTTRAGIASRAYEKLSTPNASTQSPNDNFINKNALPRQVDQFCLVDAASPSDNGGHSFHLLSLKHKLEIDRSALGDKSGGRNFAITDDDRLFGEYDFNMYDDGNRRDKTRSNADKFRL